jgi:hypothetical protein
VEIVLPGTTIECPGAVLKYPVKMGDTVVGTSQKLFGVQDKVRNCAANKGILRTPEPVPGQVLVIPYKAEK